MKLLKKSFGAPRTLFFIGLIGLVSASNGRAQTLVPIDEPGDPNTTITATGINDSGQVVGISYDTNHDLSSEQAVLYSNGAITDLGMLPGDTRSVATGINNAGQIVGSSGGSTTTAFIYSQGTMTAIAGLGSGAAVGINNSGQIAGDIGQGAILYSSGVVTNLGTLPNTVFATATSINDSGQIVGSSYTNGATEAYLYSNGTITDLGLGTAYSINNAGQVVGSAAGDSSGAFLYSNGTRITLGSSGQAVSINNLGQVVGDSVTLTNEAVPFIYSESTGLQSLNTLYSSLLVSGKDSQSGFISLNDVTAINDSGEIIGSGNYWNGTSDSFQSFLLDPISVPEPNTIILSGVGLGLLVLSRRMGLFRAKRA